VVWEPKMRRMRYLPLFAALLIVDAGSPTGRGRLATGSPQLLHVVGRRPSPGV
jgi:hypothetical protein